MKKSSRTVLLASSLALLAGCSQTPTGSVGIWQSRWTGYISKEVAGPGLHPVLNDSLTNVDVTQTRAEVGSMHPKDEHGVQLKDVSVVVEYSLNPKRVAYFYRDTKEIDNEPNTPYNTIGLKILERSAIPYAVQIATEKSTPQTIASHLDTYAHNIRMVLNQRLHKLYPHIDPFIINSVTVPTFDLPRAIQKQVNAKAGYQAELQTIAAERTVIQQRKKLVTLQAGIQADALAQAAKGSGLTPEEIIAWEKARALYRIDLAPGAAKKVVMQK